MIETRILYAKSNEPVTVQFTEINRADKKIHSYKVLSPSKYAGKKTGCTSVTSFRDKSGPLMQWSANLAVEAKNNGADDNTAKYAHRTYKDASGALGTAVHYWCEQYIAGVELDYTDEMKPCVEGFVRWWKANNPETIGSEDIVYSKQHDYCGKLDWRGNLHGRYGLIDFKTGSWDEEYNSYRKAKTGRIRAKTEHFIQNAGYDLPLIEEFGTPAEFYGVLYIPITGNVQYFETTHTSQARLAFVDTLNAQRRWRDLEKLNEYELREVA